MRSVGGSSHRTNSSTEICIAVIAADPSCFPTGEVSAAQPPCFSRGQRLSAFW
jgi:hypothetical protein